MSITRAVARSTLIQFAGKAASTALGLVAIGVMTRTLGLEQFGWYIIATGYLQFVGILSDFGFTVTTSNLLAEGKFDRALLLNTIFSWRLVTALIFLGLAPLIFLVFPYRAEIKLAVGISALAFFCFALNQVFIGYFREQLRLGIVMIGEVLGRLALVLGVLLVAINRGGFIATIAAIAAGALINTIYLYYHTAGLKLCFDRVVGRAILIKAWPTGLSVIANAVYLQGDRLILPLFASAEIVGLYGASYRVIEVVIQLAAMVMGTVMPLVTAAWASGNRPEFKRRAELGLNLLALFIFPFVAGLVVTAGPVLHFIAGAGFVVGAPFLAALALSLIGVCFGMIFGHYALALNRQRAALWVFASDAILSGIGYIILIPRFGAWGAVGVTIFSEVYAGLGLALVVIQGSGWRPRLSVLAKITLSSLLMALAVFLAQPLPLSLAVALGGSIYIGLLLISRAIKWVTIKEALALKPFARSE